MDFDDYILGENWFINDNETEIEEFGESSEGSSWDVFALVFGSIISIVLTVATIGNSGILYYYFRSRCSQLKTATDVYISARALADLLTVFHLIVEYALLLASWQYGKFGCKAFVGIFYAGHVTSALVLVLLTAQLYLDKQRPLTVLQGSLYVLLTIPFTISLSCIPFYFADGYIGICSVNFPEFLFLDETLTHLFYVFFVLFGIHAVLILTILIMRKRNARNYKPIDEVDDTERTISSSHTEFQQQQYGQLPTSNGRTAEKNTNNLVFAMITVFFVCKMPFQILVVGWMVLSHILQTGYGNTHVFTLTMHFSILADVLMLALNPILVVAFNQDIVETILKFCCGRCSNQKEEPQMITMVELKDLTNPFENNQKFSGGQGEYNPAFTL